MKLLEKILFVTDLGDAAKRAQETAENLAQKYRSQVVLLHAIPSIFDTSCDIGELKELASGGLAEVEQSFRDKGIAVLASHVECGEPLDYTLELAEKYDVNVIVQAGENFQPTATVENSKSIGITAERIIRRSTTPVWTVKKGCGVLPEVLVCPVDFSEASSRALKNALFLTREFKALLHVVHVVAPPNSQPGNYEPLANKVESNSMAATQETLEKLIRSLDFHNVKWQAHLMQGDVVTNILKLAEEEKADLLVMGAVGGTNSKQLQLGVVATQLIHQIPCALVTVKKEHAIRVSVEHLLADLETRFKHGKELLEKGHADEALPFFKKCLEENSTFVAAWEGLAEAYHRLDRKEEAAQALENASEIQKRLWEKRVEFDLKKKYWK